jgi:hypothetical protein
MWTQIAGVGLTVLVPGLLLARLVHARHQHAERSTPFELVGLAAVLGILVTALVAHALASWSLFSGPALYVCLGALCLVFALLGLRWNRALVPLDWKFGDLAPFVLIAVLGLRYAPVGHFIFASADEGNYPNAAVEIAEAGHSIFQDETLASLPPELKQLTHVDYMRPFYSQDTATRAQCGVHGLHTMPAFQAVLYLHGGRELMLDSPLLFALVALAGFHLIVRRFAGPWAALIATAALGLNPASVWFARITFAEGMSQMFLLWGFAMFATAWPGDASPTRPGSLSTPRLVAAGLLLGAVNHAKIDFFLMPWAVLVGVVMLLWAGYRREARAFVAAYGVMFLLAAWYALTDHRIYYTAQFFNVEMYGSKNAILYLGGVFTPVALIGVAFAIADRLEGLAVTLRVRTLTIVGGALLTLFAAYLYWVPPLRVAWHVALHGLPDYPWNRILLTWQETFWPGGTAESLAGWQRSLAKPADVYDVKNVLTYTELTMSAIGLYMTPIATFVGLVGAFVMLLRRDAHGFVPFLLFFMAQTAFILLVSGQIDYGSAHHHAPGRRFLGITIPALTALCVVPWFVLAREVPYGRILRDLSVGLLVVVAMKGNDAAQPIYDTPVYDQSLVDIDALDALCPPDTVLLAMQDDEIGQRYQLPLRFFAREKALLFHANVTSEGVEAMITHLRGQGLRPVLISGQEHPDTSPAKQRAIALLDPVGHATYQVTENVVEYQRFRLPQHQDFGSWRPTLELHGVPPR